MGVLLRLCLVATIFIVSLHALGVNRHRAHHKRVERALQHHNVHDNDLEAVPSPLNIGTRAGKEPEPFGAGIASNTVGSGDLFGFEADSKISNDQFSVNVLGHHCVELHELTATSQDSKESFLCKLSPNSIGVTWIVPEIFIQEIKARLAKQLGIGSLAESCVFTSLIESLEKRRSLPDVNLAYDKITGAVSLYMRYGADVRTLKEVLPTISYSVEDADVLMVELVVTDPKGTLSVDATVELKVEIVSGVVGYGQLLTLESLLIQIRNVPNVPGRSIITGNVQGKLGICPRYSKGKNLIVSMDMTMEVSENACIPSFTSSYRNSTGGTQAPINAVFCSSDVHTNGFQLCFEVDELTYSNKGAKVNVKKLYLSEPYLWLEGFETSGTLKVDGEEPHIQFWTPHRADFKQKRHLEVELSVFIPFDKRTPLLEVYCEGHDKQKLKGQMNMGVDLVKVADEIDDYAITPFIESVIVEIIKKRFLYSFTTDHKRGNQRRLVMPFWGSLLERPYLTIMPDFDCSQSQQYCYFYEDAPVLASAKDRDAMGTSEETVDHKLNRFGILIEHIVITTEETSVNLPEMQLPVNVGLPSNVNRFLGLSFAKEAHDWGEFLKSLPMALTNEDLTRYLANPDNSIAMNFVMRNPSVTESRDLLVSITGEMRSFPFRKAYVDAILKQTTLQGELPKFKLFKENGYVSMRMQALSEIHCGPSYVTDACVFRMPQLLMIYELLNSIGANFLSDTFPISTLGFGRIPSLNGKEPGTPTSEEDISSIMFGTSYHTDGQEKQVSGYREILKLLRELVGVGENLEKDVKRANEAFGTTTATYTQFLNDVGADELKSINTALCEKLTYDVECKGVIRCNTELCPLKPDIARTKLRKFIAQQLMRKSLNSVRITEWIVPPKDIREITFTLKILSYMVPNPSMKYFSDTETPSSFPRFLSYEFRANQDGSIFGWLRPRSSADLTDDQNVSPFMTLYQPDMVSIIPGVFGYTFEGLFVGYFQQSAGMGMIAPTQALFGIGVDMAIDFIDRRKHALDLVTEKAIDSDHECSTSFPTEEHELPHSSLMGLSVTMDNFIALVHTGTPYFAYSNKLGLSAYSPMGTRTNLHVTSPFLPNVDFRWPEELQLFEPTFVTLPKWMGDFCVFPGGGCPEICTECDASNPDVPPKPIAEKVFRMQDYLSALVVNSGNVHQATSSRAQPCTSFDSRHLLAASDLSVSRKQSLRLPLIPDILVSHAFATFDQLEQALNGRMETASKFPSYPESDINAFEFWRGKYRSDPDGTGKTYMYDLVELVHDAVATRLKSTDTRFTHGRQDATSGVNGREQFANDFQDMLEETIRSALLITMAFKKNFAINTASKDKALQCLLQGFGVTQVFDLVWGPSELAHIVQLGCQTGAPPNCDFGSNEEKDFCFTAVANSYLGPEDPEVEDFYVPKEMSPLIQLVPQPEESQLRILKPRKRRTLHRTELEGEVFILGIPGDATLLISDNSVVVLAILHTAPGDATAHQIEHCNSPDGLSFDRLSCRCIDEESQLAVDCPLTSVQGQVVYSDIEMKNENEKTMGMRLDLTLRQVTRKQINLFMRKAGLDSATMNRILGYIGSRTVWRLRIGDIVLTDLESNPGRIIIEICFEPDDCVTNQSWSTLFVDALGSAWGEEDVDYSNVGSAA